MSNNSKHEKKYCPKCGKAFECKPGNITQCQCFGVPLNSEELYFIKEIYDDCLCADCMLKMKQVYKEKRILKYYSSITQDDI
ncbi:Hypothetical protein IALB_2303 [Ignavibacterium album JCM 16511]|uniref:Cysteine-rich CWC n=1 Tax=Ignavibacterium album (strain DSM 19864 / JCM 16511 / NBRC 101810 / Mat9-16) TaxID=945713 RepID=I0ALZ9_IGNAJ|nr:Hypothetical protein IALB_2303 [Ignavibacterium album JCM 16511]